MFLDYTTSSMAKAYSKCPFQSAIWCATDCSMPNRHIVKVATLLVEFLPNVLLDSFLMLTNNKKR